MINRQIGKHTDRERKREMEMEMKRCLSGSVKAIAEQANEFIFQFSCKARWDHVKPPTTQ